VALLFNIFFVYLLKIIIMVTREDLEKIGVVHIGVLSKLYPNKFWIPVIEKEVNLYEPYSYDEIFEIIYKEGFDKGKEQGSKDKIEQIKDVLGLI